jgi:hypothetical protein
MDENEVQLIAEQLNHAVDLLRADIATLRTDLAHDRKLSAYRLDLLEGQTKDHENRLRAATEGVTQFKVFSGLSNGGSMIMAAAALVRSFFIT